MKPWAQYTLIVATSLAIAVVANEAIEWAKRRSTPGPEWYREAVAEHIRKTFVDPYSIRDAEISIPVRIEPVLDMPDPPGGQWSVCVMANARNRLGGYVGRRAWRYRFEGDVITAASDGDSAQRFCAKVDYVSFREIEGS